MKQQDSEAVDSLLLLCQAAPLIENEDQKIDSSEIAIEKTSLQNDRSNKKLSTKTTRRIKKEMSVNTTSVEMSHSVHSSPKIFMGTKQLTPLTLSLINNIELEIANIDNRNSLKIKKHDLTYDCQYIFPGESFTDIYCGKLFGYQSKIYLFKFHFIK